jgi:hypothetical protein
MRAAGLERAAQRCLGADEMGLTHVFVERAGPQAIRQWPVGAVPGALH